MAAQDRATPDRERQEYRAEKEDERKRQEQPAAAEKDAAWQSKDHLDPTRAGNKPNQGDTAPDAVGQAERGSIDQTVTDKGFTQTR